MRFASILAAGLASACAAEAQVDPFPSVPMAASATTLLSEASPTPCAKAPSAALKSGFNCGSAVSLYSSWTDKYVGGSGEKQAGTGKELLATTGAACEAKEHYFELHCVDRAPGQPLTFGDRVALRRVKDGAWVQDGASRKAKYNVQTYQEAVRATLGDASQTTADDSDESFHLLDPAELAGHDAVTGREQISFRNRFGRFLAVDDKGALTSKAYPGATEVGPAAMFLMTLHGGPASGCADGTREGFTDLARFPNIAGCAAKWKNGLGVCPERHIGSNDEMFGCSACATGWHLCGWRPTDDLTTSTCEGNKSGTDRAEVSRHVCYDDCREQPGLFASGAVFASGRDGRTCDMCTDQTFNLGCGHETVAHKGATGSDCSAYSLLAGASCWNNLPLGIRSDTTCLGTNWKCCDANPSAGAEGNWRGVMCCKDGVTKTPSLGCKR